MQVLKFFRQLKILFALALLLVSFTVRADNLRDEELTEGKSASTCVDYLIQQTLNRGQFYQRTRGAFMLSGMIDPLGLHQIVRITQTKTSDNFFSWGNKKYQIPLVDITLTDEQDLYSIFKDIYGSAFVNRFGETLPPVVPLGKGGYRHVVISPLHSKKALKISLLSKQASEHEILGAAIDQWRASFIPQVLQDFFKDTGILVHPPEAPMSYVGSSPGKYAAVEQTLLQGGLTLAKFLPALVAKSGGQFPFGKYPRFEKQLRALSMNNNLGLFALKDSVRRKVEAIYEGTSLPGNIIVGQKPLNALEQLDRAVLEFVYQNSPIANEALHIGDRMVFGPNGLPLFKPSAGSEHGFELLTQRSMYGLDLSPTNFLVKPITRENSDVVIDYQLHNSDN